MKTVKKTEKKAELKAEPKKEVKYSLYKDNQFVKSFNNKEEAVREAKVLGVRVEEE